MLIAENKIKKRYFVRIPKNIGVCYCREKNILSLSGPNGLKSIKVPVVLFLSAKFNTILVSDKLLKDNSIYLTKKKLKMVQGSTVARIKQIIIEITKVLYRKLNLVGVGYRAFPHVRQS